jgi:hypothetical protein
MLIFQKKVDALWAVYRQFHKVLHGGVVLDTVKYKWT